MISLNSPVTIGTTQIAKIKNSKELTQLIKPKITTDTLLVKPNFVDRAPGTYTDTESLRTLFEAIENKIIVIEGHQLIRCITEEDSGLTFSHKGKDRDRCGSPEAAGATLLNMMTGTGSAKDTTGTK